MKPHLDSETGEKDRNRIKFGFSNGAADHGVGIVGSFFEYRRTISEEIAIDVKVNFLSQSGSIGSAAGLSDLFFNTTYSFSDRAFGSIGVKIPLSDGNNKENGMPLPMDLQPSLGTTDFISGGGFSVRGIAVAVAIQQPMTQNNNQFLSGQYPSGTALRLIQSTNNYQRSGDALLRISYPVMIDRHWNIVPSLLPIYHLSNDSYTDAAGVEQTISGSQGLTLNGAIFTQYTFDNGQQVEASLGVPFITRSARPDGLTRSYVVTIEYGIRF